MTLIEVLMAVSVLAIGIVGVLRAYAGSITVLETAQYTVDASVLLKQKMAEVDQLILEEEEIPVGSERGTFEDIFENFSWEWSITPAGEEGLYRLSAAVSHSFNPREVRLETYVADKNFEIEAEDEQ